MHVDLGVNPHRTIVGLVTFGIGVALEVDIALHLDDTPFWFALISPLVLGFGGGVLLGQWHKTTRLRRKAREWADAHPGEDPDDEPPQQPQRRVTGPEDDIGWTAYSRQWLGKPKNPTDESGEMGDHD